MLTLPLLPMGLQALAYGCTAAALVRLFGAASTRLLGPHRWLIAGAMAAASAMEFLQLAAAALPRPAVAQAAGLLSSLCLLAAAVSLWPFLAGMSVKIASAQNQRLDRRLRQADAEAKEARRWLLLAEEIAHVGHWYYDGIKTEITLSDEIYRIHGVDKDTSALDFERSMLAFHPDDRMMVTRAVQQAMEQKIGYELEARIVRPDGSIRHVLSRAAAQLDDAGNAVALFGVVLDLTEQKLVEESLRLANLQAEQTNTLLREMALVDSLTGLPNRRHFDSAFDVEFRRAARDDGSLGLIMIDLDHFKGFNDLYGHPAGDACLAQVAKAIESVTNRPTDLVARYGGEEMVVLLPNTDLEGAIRVAQNAAAAVRALQIPHSANGSGIVTISGGVTIRQGDAGAQIPLQLLRQADLALYQAKLGGRNRICMFYADDPMDAPLIMVS